MLDLILIVVALALGLLILRDQRNKPKKPKAGPFALKEMKTVRECKRCKVSRTRKFKQGDFILKLDTKCKCGWRMIITKIYHVKAKTRKQLKWEREMAKWQ